MKSSEWRQTFLGVIYTSTVLQLTNNKKYIPEGLFSCHLSLPFKHLLALVKHSFTFFFSLFIFSLNVEEAFLQFHRSQNNTNTQNSLFFFNTYICKSMFFSLYPIISYPLKTFSEQPSWMCFHTGILTWLHVIGSRFLAVRTGLYPCELTYSFTMNDTKDSIKEKRRRGPPDKLLGQEKGERFKRLIKK